MAEPWTVLRSQAIFSHHVLSLRTDTIRNPRNSHEHDYFVIEMPDFVNVIPLTPDGHVVMIKVYRHGTQEVLLEVPGGLVDPGETPLEAAHRELLEETGYQAEDIAFIGKASPMPGLVDDRQHIFVASNVRKVAGLNLDEGEDIEIVIFHLAEVKRKIAEGEITNGLILLAFYWYFSAISDQLGYPPGPFSSQPVRRITQAAPP